MTEQERLQCNSIDINGLNPCDRSRIEEVGFDRWLDEVTTPNAAGTQVSRHHRYRKKCAVCEAVFLATRADAKYCSHKCQLRGNRRGLAFRGLSKNISGNAGPQAIECGVLLRPLRTKPLPPESRFCGFRGSDRISDALRK
jgi:hypothetical protein